ncbi:hypothetical protein SpCBS45565_g07837 [Spizellomyces sp. 'palustris']|nr:hypothetical protein SpCBS45565_g07837 [Spizellomyces sp. 'palustris']
MQIKNTVLSFILLLSCSLVNATPVFRRHELVDLAVKVTGQARFLWAAHVATTGDYAIAVGSDNWDLANAIKPKALEIAPKMANFLGSFYPEDDVSTFEKLFSEHIVLLSKITDETKAGDVGKVKELYQTLLEGTKKLSAVVESFNPPAYPKDKIFALLKEHEDLAIGAAAAIIEHRNQEGYGLATQALEQSQVIADGLAAGIYQKLGY